ncbi:TPA: ribonuclease PH [Candidatus Dependentiae bacterium]|nr:MAG: Ribonuclease PH [candidate division TM6 bacterium GW2011_GWF2_36_131]KKQ02861.1 MAG: Ribonuclease PH [candidate division TM6 bacterium GW2011_GWE2_36_25]KKQ19514.1 MAG: Ribonuclease PH [candidate division TM6 bacterium GW2011_GWA2_36_9]HBR70227.1 ribonuclease PH [Candidatus Dependentiae bacterium]HCU00611.1 ribonuclease PH [Candidatus Dependentiae bacterium]
MKRADGRALDQLRELKITKGIFEYAPGSVLFEIGKTKVLCAVTLAEGVPPFLRGKGTGWLTAEYALLPAATVTRSPRESSSFKRNGRSIEISRILGRALRSVVDLSRFGENTIMVDCDVLQADGGTRCAAVCGAQSALNLAVQYWLDVKFIEQSIIKNQVAAVSTGAFDGTAILDLNAFEDNNIDSDFNFILTDHDEIVEIQGTAELGTVSWQQFDEMRALAQKGIQELCSFIKERTL